MATASLILSCLALILGIVVFIRGELHTKETRRQLDSSLGEPSVEVRWDNPSEEGLLPCRITAKSGPLTAVTLKVVKESKAIDYLAENEGKNLELRAVPEGTKTRLVSRILWHIGRVEEKA